MSEANKQTVGDGQDNYAGAAKQGYKAARKIAQKAASKTAEATVNAAASSVKAGVESGKAVAEIAAGTASGGPWGAIISAAWSLRHTLFKILVCICLFVVILITMIVSLPDIIFQDIKANFSDVENVEVNTLEVTYFSLADDIKKSIDKSYEKAKDKARSIITDDKYDGELSEARFDDTLDESYNYDVAYILAVYSISRGQNGTSRAQLLNTLDVQADTLFTVVTQEKTAEVTRTVDGEEKTYSVTYAVCTIELYDRGKLLSVFDVDKDSEYKNYGISCGEYAEYMSNALSMTLGGIEEK